eukprot:371655-Amphidinium_carterae.1
MEQAKLDADAVNAGRAAVRAEREARRLEANATPAARKATKPVVEKARLSKAQRKQGKQAEGEKDGDFEGFDVQVDGVAVASASKHKGQQQDLPPAEQFYLSVDRDQRVEDKERGLAMEEYQLDIAPDERDAISKAKSVIRWDVKRSKMSSPKLQKQIWIQMFWEKR